MALDTVLPHLLMLLALAGAAADIRSGTIPNRLTLPAVALALLVRSVLGGWAALVEGCFGLLLTSVGPLIVFVVTRGAGIGGGDVKLLAGLGALAGPVVGIRILVGSCSFMLVFAALMLAWRGQLIMTLLRSLRIVLRLLVPNRHAVRDAEVSLSSLRMGPFIAAAVLATAGGPWFRGIMLWLSFV